eukprot:GHVP01050843.1.p1 GENE.GHVP01050843.1~~GHVP01050843.1.p1  ORF type:complete len:165 (+),score=29.26 GHVP01050843.1:476-970(+)
MITITRAQTISTIVMILGFQLLRYVPVKTKEDVKFLRAFYIISQTSCVLVYYYLLRLVEKKQDKHMVDVEMPKAMFSSEETQVERISVTNYDKRELMSQIKTAVFGTAVMGFLHLKFNITQPLLVQAISPIKTLLMHPLVMIHIYGMSSEKHPELIRPFDKKSN